MDRRKMGKIIFPVLLLSLLLKLYLIFRYGSLLCVNSDDINYVKSAVVLLQKGLLTYHNYNEPTVFIMPAYPVFLSAVFRVFGWGFAGLQAVRVIQAVMGTGVLLIVFYLGCMVLDEAVASGAVILMAFYPPNLTTPGYFLTETPFTLLLCLLLYLSLRFAPRMDVPKAAILGLVWVGTTLFRPTAALYPLLFFTYLLLAERIKFWRAFRLGVVMGLVFLLAMLPWWVRNYREYGDFIPLTASSGNPMLQGTYVGYNQTPENTIVYKLGKTLYENNRIETGVARQRIRQEFKKDFWGYLLWFTLGKTERLWRDPFYWNAFAGISMYAAVGFHYLLLLGFGGFLIALRRGLKQHALIFILLVYFNVVHCVYMAFDRYAYPLMPLLAVYSSFFFAELLRRRNQVSIGWDAQ